MGVVQTLAQIFQVTMKSITKNIRRYWYTQKEREVVKSDRTIKYKRFVFILFKIKNI